MSLVKKGGTPASFLIVSSGGVAPLVSMVKHGADREEGRAAGLTGQAAEAIMVRHQGGESPGERAYNLKAH